MKTFDYYFNLINTYYGTKCADRSEVPYMAHIVEGLNVLEAIGATENAKKAFMMHPIFQSDGDFLTNLNKYAHAIDPYILALVIEYRNIANAYLSRRKINSIDEIKLSTSEDVNDMLIADKVQNYKDFLLYHVDTHPRSGDLSLYFQNWLEKLFKGTSLDFEELVKVCYNVAVTLKITKNGKTLLLNRFGHDRTFVGQCHVGGKLEFGEKLLEGLSRESQEEIGMPMYDSDYVELPDDYAKIKYFDCFLCETKKGLKSVFTYEVILNDDYFPIKLNKEEFESYVWVDKETWQTFWESDMVDYEKGMFYAIDYDNTIAPDCFPKVGRPTQEAIDGMQRILSNPNNHIIIHTMRNSNQQDEILGILRGLGLRILGVNEHLIQHQWTDSNKLYADYFIDDRNLNTPLKNKMVDWSKLKLKI